MKKILITGGSGLIGRKLTEILINSGYEVGWISRKMQSVESVKIFLWNVEENFIDEEAIVWADVIIHLAGESISAKRWTTKRKKEIIESRVLSAELLINSIKSTPNKIQAIICASAIGYYGERKNDPEFLELNENSEPGKGFLSESVCEWEKATNKFAELNIRTVLLRIGIILSYKGGALKELLKTRSLRILPVLGDGKQIYSWIHIDDVCGIFLFAIENNIKGTFNTVAPNPVSQKQLMKSIKGSSKQILFLFPVPAFMLKIILGEMSTAVLSSQNVNTKKIESSGYHFKFEQISDTIDNILQHY